MTLREILKKAGQTDEQINQVLGTLGPATGIFETTLSEANRLNVEAATKLAEATEREKKLNEFWTNDATPQINTAFSEKATAEAQAAFYKKQAEEAKKAGFLPADAPGFQPNANANANVNGNANQTRNASGEFVPNANVVPGSPAYMTMEQATQALAETAYLMTEHHRLFNEPLPDLQSLMSEAVQTRSKARDVWTKKYNVDGKRKEIADTAQKAHDDKIAKETEARVRKEMADRYGNEHTRPMVQSRYPNYARDEKTGATDKLAWTKKDKREVLRSRIMEQVEKETGHRVQ